MFLSRLMFLFDKKIGVLSVKVYHMSVLLVVTTLFTCGKIAFSQKVTPLNKAWEEKARKSGLSETDISTLKKNRILVTNEAYKQIFSAYLSGEKPLFITSDSLLNAYHVLYEESVVRLENTMASRFPEILKRILNNLKDTDKHLKGKPALVSAAKERAMLVTGIALRLLDNTFRFQNEKLNEILDRETKRIVGAKGIEMPKWLGRPDASFLALDYSRYKPRGFYTRSAQLKRYFRAVSWLQSIPFRVNKDEELLAILMLGNCLTFERFINDLTKRDDIVSFFRTYKSFIGAGDDWDLITAAKEVQDELRMDLNGNDLEVKRDWLREEAENNRGGPLINDQLRFASNDPKTVAQPHFRILSAYRTPSAILFQRTTDPRRFRRPYPNGLEVAAALGSTFARKSLRYPQKENLLKTIDSCQTYFQGRSLYLAYLYALKALVDKPEPDAPDFMQNESWQIKSCNTVLAGWAQLRHTWVLQAKQAINTYGDTWIPEGFVEPEPDFFSRMADLADETKGLLKQSGAFNPDYTQIIRSIEEFKGIIEGVKDEKQFKEKFVQLPQEKKRALKLPLTLMEMSPSESKEGSEAYFKETTKWFGTVIEDIEKGHLGRHPKLEAMLKEYDIDLDQLWERFAKVSRRLEVIAHKQLRGADFSNREIVFIMNYGSTIAKIMLYSGNSYLTPRDDSPRVTDVYANPQKGGYLHVGVARPRKLYVLYPWKGKTILCEGAVMPYYEFVMTTRLTDKSWKERLDSEKRPSIPKWLSPVVSGGNLSKPKLKNKH